MNNGLRKHLKQLPYFLLYNYPSKLKTYKALSEKNKRSENKEDKVKLNAYRSPSPMNELCDYICAWEKKNILWDKSINDLTDIRNLIINTDLDLSDNRLRRTCRKYINKFADIIHNHYNPDRKTSGSDMSDNEAGFDIIADYYRQKLLDELQIPEELLANYIIDISYKTVSINKSFAWTAFGDYIIKNLKEHSDGQRSVSITQVPYKTAGSYEYLGKYYEYKEENEHG